MNPGDDPGVAPDGSPSSSTVDHPPKHDLGLLVALLPDASESRNLAVAGLTVYAVDQRCVAGTSNPMALSERPTWDEADEAIDEAELALTVIRADLDAAGWSP